MKKIILALYIQMDLTRYVEMDFQFKQRGGQLLKILSSSCNFYGKKIYYTYKSFYLLAPLKKFLTSPLFMRIFKVHALDFNQRPTTCLRTKASLLVVLCFYVTVKALILGGCFIRLTCRSYVFESCI